MYGYGTKNKRKENKSKYASRGLHKALQNV